MLCIFRKDMGHLTNSKRSQTNFEDDCYFPGGMAKLGSLSFFKGSYISRKISFYIYSSIRGKENYQLLEYFQLVCQLTLRSLHIIWNEEKNDSELTANSDPNLTSTLTTPWLGHLRKIMHKYIISLVCYINTQPETNTLSGKSINTTRHALGS